MIKNSISALILDDVIISYLEQIFSSYFLLVRFLLFLSQNVEKRSSQFLTHLLNFYWYDFSFFFFAFLMVPFLKQHLYCFCLQMLTFVNKTKKPATPCSFVPIIIKEIMVFLTIKIYASLVYSTSFKTILSPLPLSFVCSRHISMVDCFS